MNTQTKAQIAKITLFLLTLVASVFLIAIIVLVVCAGFQINPFKHDTTTFLYSAFFGLIGLSAILVLLNVATNISLIADAKIAELPVEKNTATFKFWIAAIVASIVGIVAFLFIGTNISQQAELQTVRQSADAVIRENDKLISEISDALASGTSADYKRVNEICEFLEKRRRGLPNLILIYSGKFEGETAFYEIGKKNYIDASKEYKPDYFTCTQDFDCDYLTKFFAGENVAVMQKFTKDTEHSFAIYIPVTNKSQRFILLFDKRSYYADYGQFSS